MATAAVSMLGVQTIPSMIRGTTGACAALQENDVDVGMCGSKIKLGVSLCKAHGGSSDHPCV